MTNDRFHVWKLFYEATDELRVTYQWMAKDLENEEIQRCKEQGKEYIPFRYANGDTRKQLLARSKHILMKNYKKWTESQRIRAEIIFQYYPELKSVYNLALELTDVARAKIASWHKKIENLRYGYFKTVTNTMQNYYDTILNYFINRQTNAFAESFNAKIKAFIAQFSGVKDIPFFLFRLCKLCA